MDLKPGIRDRILTFLKVYQPEANVRIRLEGWNNRVIANMEVNCTVQELKIALGALEIPGLEMVPKHNTQSGQSPPFVPINYSKPGIDSVQLCGFNEAWVGRCNNPRPCVKHMNQRCWKCDRPAVANCDATMGLVCGVPYCAEHPHHH